MTGSCKPETRRAISIVFHLVLMTSRVDVCSTAYHGPRPETTTSSTIELDINQIQLFNGSPNYDVEERQFGEDFRSAIGPTDTATKPPSTSIGGNSFPDDGTGGMDVVDETKEFPVYEIVDELGQPVDSDSAVWKNVEIPMDMVDDNRLSGTDWVDDTELDSPKAELKSDDVAYEGDTAKDSNGETRSLTETDRDSRVVDVNEDRNAISNSANTTKIPEGKELASSDFDVVVSASDDSEGGKYTDQEYETAIIEPGMSYGDDIEVIKSVKVMKGEGRRRAQRKRKPLQSTLATRSRGRPAQSHVTSTIQRHPIRKRTMKMIRRRGVRARGTGTATSGRVNQRQVEPLKKQRPENQIMLVGSPETILLSSRQPASVNHGSRPVLLVAEQRGPLRGPDRAPQSTSGSFANNLDELRPRYYITSSQQHQQQQESADDTAPQEMIHPRQPDDVFETLDLLSRQPPIDNGRQLNYFKIAGRNKLPGKASYSVVRRRPSRIKLRLVSSDDEVTGVNGNVFEIVDLVERPSRVVLQQQQQQQPTPQRRPSMTSSLTSSLTETAVEEPIEYVLETIPDSDIDDDHPQKSSVPLLTSSSGVLSGTATGSESFIENNDLFRLDSSSLKQLSRPEVEDQIDAGYRAVLVPPRNVQESYERGHQSADIFLQTDVPVEQTSGNERRAQSQLSSYTAPSYPGMKGSIRFEVPDPIPTNQPTIVHFQDEGSHTRQVLPVHALDGRRYTTEPAPSYFVANFVRDQPQPQSPPTTNGDKRPIPVEQVLASSHPEVIETQPPPQYDLVQSFEEILQQLENEERQNYQNKQQQHQQQQQQNRQQQQQQQQQQAQLQPYPGVHHHSHPAQQLWFNKPTIDSQRYEYQ